MAMTWNDILFLKGFTTDSDWAGDVILCETNKDNKFLLCAGPQVWEFPNESEAVAAIEAVTAGVRTQEALNRVLAEVARNNIGGLCG